MAHRLQSEVYTTSLQNLLANDKSYDGEARRFDIVQIEGIEMAEEIPLIRQNFPSCKIVYDAHNAETELQRRAYLSDRKSPGRWHTAAYSWIQTRRLLQFEANTCKISDWVTAVSEVDASFLRALAPETRISIIPNCINVADYQQGENESIEEFDILFSGKMDYRPNVDAVLWFAEEVWPLIVQTRPNTTWGIVGQKPHKRLNRVGLLKGVTVTGRVEHIQPYMAGASIYILPFRMGSGTRLKLIEAMASGMAVVSTTLGVQGYSVSGGKELVLADNALEFAEATLELLNDSQSRQRLGREARAFSRQYDWRLIIPKFDEVYRQL
jgi:glycosyltransferase involved in cell wall biosynthesis